MRSLCLGDDSVIIQREWVKVIKAVNLCQHEAYYLFSYCVKKAASAMPKSLKQLPGFKTNIHRQA
jgi:hypothetical protein